MIGGPPLETHPDALPPSPGLVVPTRGLPFLEKGVITVAVGLFPLLAGMFYFLAIGRFPGGLTGCIIAAAVVSASVFVVGASRMFVRGIDVEEDGISFRYLFHSEYGSWSDLAPSPFAIKHGEWYLARRNPGSHSNHRVRGYRLTIEQARAVLSFPACPKWTLPESVVRELMGAPTTAS